MSGSTYFAQSAFGQGHPPVGIFGVDSVTQANADVTVVGRPGTFKFFDIVAEKAGSPPNYWGRYVGRTERNLTPTEAQYLRGEKNCRILLIYGGTTSTTVSTEQHGINAATRAIAIVSDPNGLAVPRGKKVCIYCNLEPSWSPKREFFKGWFDTMQASDYVGGVYGNTGPYDQTMGDFNTEFCAAYAAYSSVRAGLLWSHRPSFTQCKFRRSVFNPRRPPCPIPTVIWQHSIECSVGPDSSDATRVDDGGAARVDPDLATALGFEKMWALGGKVVFWKYNPSTFVPQLLHSADGTAWTPVDFGTASAGQTNHLGQQLVMLGSKLLAMADSPLAVYETTDLATFTKRYGTDLWLGAPTEFDGRIILRGSTPWPAWSPNQIDHQTRSVPSSQTNFDDPFAGDPAYLSGPFSWSGTQVSLPYSGAPDGARSYRRLDSQWGFNVRSDVIITGIRVLLSTTFAGGPPSQTNAVHVFLRVGTQWSTEKLAPAGNQVILGGPTDLWGLSSIAVSDVNASTFGVGIVALQGATQDGSSGTLTVTSVIDSIEVHYAVAPKIWEDNGGGYTPRYLPGAGEVYLYHIADAFGTIWATFTTILRKWIGGTTWSDVWTSGSTLDRTVYWPAQNRLMMARQNPSGGSGVGEILAFDGTITPPPASLAGITDRVGYMVVVGNDLYVMAVVTTNGVTGSTWKIYRCTDLNTAILVGQGTLTDAVIPTMALVWHPLTTAFYAAIGSTTLQKIYKAVSPVSGATPAPISELTFTEVYGASESASNHVRDGTVADLG